MPRQAVLLAVLLALLAACGPAQPLAPTCDPAVGKPCTRPTDGMAMVYVPAGEFTMGSLKDDPEARRDEMPQHIVYLDAFWIDRTEVTNAQYRRCVEAGTCREPGCWDQAKFNAADQPVVCVDWWDAQSYCQWVGAQLPTEAQWEKAARGTDGRRYPWGDEWDSSRCNSIESSLRRTVPVGSYPDGASPYGALDMAGNAWEWVADRFSDGYYAIAPTRNPTGSETGGMRLLRGGSWLNYPQQVRCAVRLRIHPTYRMDVDGFRCAMPGQYEGQ
jgi:formylglycine-generating enzyme required for sulfatase activity